MVLLSDENEEEQREDSLLLKVRDVMVREVITVDENSSVKEAVDTMNEFQIGSLIVLERGKAMGIVTERDFLRRVMAGAKDVVNTRVKEIARAIRRPNWKLLLRLTHQATLNQLPVIVEMARSFVSTTILTKNDRDRQQSFLLISARARKFVWNTLAIGLNMCAPRTDKRCMNKEIGKEESEISEKVHQRHEIVACSFFPHVQVTFVSCLSFSLPFPSLRVLGSPPSERVPEDQIASTGLRA